MADEEGSRPADEAQAAAKLLFPDEPAVEAIMAQQSKPLRIRLREALALLDLREP